MQHMHDQQATEEALRSFVHWKSRGALQSVNRNFPYPQELKPVADCFKGYSWAATRLSSAPRLFGICALRHRWSRSLAETEAVILDPQRHSAAEPNVLNHYLIIEILDPQRVRANLGMLVESLSWYLLDEHILAPPIGAAAQQA